MRGYSIKRLAIGSWVFLLFVCVLTSSARAGDPKKYFRTIKTEHFNVHYHQGLEHEARIAATICEETHEDLTILFGWEVQGPTEVVITDRTDSANGSASAMGRPVMRLHATAPSLGMTLQAYDHYQFIEGCTVYNDFRPATGDVIPLERETLDWMQGRYPKSMVHVEEIFRKGVAYAKVGRVDDAKRMLSLGLQGFDAWGKERPEFETPGVWIELSDERSARAARDQLVMAIERAERE